MWQNLLLFNQLFSFSDDKDEKDIRPIVFGAVGGVVILLIVTAAVVVTVVTVVFLRRKHSHQYISSTSRKNSGNHLPS